MLLNPYFKVHNGFNPKPSFKKSLIFRLDNFFMACHSQIIISEVRIELPLCAYGFCKLLSPVNLETIRLLLLEVTFYCGLTLHNLINHNGTKRQAARRCYVVEATAFNVRILFYWHWFTMPTSSILEMEF